MKNRIIHISIDQELNSQVDYEQLEEVLYEFMTSMGIEVIVTSEDEEVLDGQETG